MNVFSRKRRVPLQLEELESRLAPAKLVSPTTVLYQETDGDLVQVIASKPCWNKVDLGTLQTIFQFDTGTVDGDLAIQQTLNKLDLAQLDSNNQRDLSVSIKVFTKLGDGVVNVGEINATEGLGRILVGGSLTKIDTGDGTNGMVGLTVNFLGNPSGPNEVSNINGNMSFFKVIFDVNEATVNINGALNQLYIGRNLVGGPDTDSGAIIVSGNMISAIVRGNFGKNTPPSDLTGAAGTGSGRLSVGGYLKGISVLGAVTGGVGDNSGTITTGLNLGNVRVGSLTGGQGLESGRIFSGGNMGLFIMPGSLVGGAGADSGQVVSTGTMLGVRAGDITGSSGDRSGSILTQGVQSNMGSVIVNGSLKGGTGNQSGAIIASGDVGVKLGRDLLGGSLPPGLGADINQTGYIQGRRITTLIVGGTFKAGTNNDVGISTLTNSGAARSQFDIGQVRIGGNFIGSATNRARITARGQEVQGTSTDVAILNIIVNGKMDTADILAGYDITDDPITLMPVPINPDAQIGITTIAGNFIASNLVAGVDSGPDGFYGTADDGVIGGTDNPAIVSSLGPIRINGGVFGTTADPADSYGIVAEYIVSLTTNAKPVQLFVAFPGPKNNTFALGHEADLTPVTTNDVIAFEV